MCRAAALLLFTMLGACDRAPILDPASVRPAMWLVEDADTRIVILGSVHQLPSDLDWMRGRVAAEVARADEAIMELAPAELGVAPALFARVSADEPVAPLARRFAEPLAARAGGYAREAGMDEGAADRLESWALALVVAQRLAADAGLAADNGVEARVAAAFAPTGRRITGLETAAQQLDMFDGLPPSTQDAMVVSAIAHADDARTRTRRLIAAWARGDVAGLTAAAEEAMADTPALVEPVIHARNRAWAQALAARMQRPGRVLVAVGAGHVVGEGSLIAELERRGLRAARLQ